MDEKPESVCREHRTDRVFELESALTLAIHWLDDDTPAYIVNELKTIRGDE